MKKKILAILLCAVMVIGMLPVYAFAEDNDFEFVVQTNRTTDGEVNTIVGYTGNESNIVIPSEIDGKAIGYIDPCAFEGMTCLESVVIADEIEYIDYYAFKDCVNLKSVTIGRWTGVHFNAFKNCSEDLVIHTYYGANVIKECAEQSGIAYDYSDTLSDDFSYVLLDDGTAKIISVTKDYTYFRTMPSSIDGYDVSVIGTGAFGNHSCDHYFIVPEGVTAIEPKAFQKCFIRTVLLPDSLTEIYGNSFYNCEYLTSIEIYESNENFTVIDNVLYSNEGKNLVLIPQGLKPKDFIVPDGVESIGEYAFSGIRTKDTKTIYIPESVQSVADNAFKNCAKTAVVYCYANSPVVEPALNAGLQVVYISGYYNYTLNDDGTAKIIKIDPAEPCDVVIPSEIDGHTVTSLGERIVYDNVFVSENRSILSLSIPDTITEIPYECFCYGTFTSVSIPSSVETIGMRAFAYCTRLEQLVLPEGLKTLKQSAFYECYSLESVTLPSTIRIDDLENCEHAFDQCKKLKNVIIPEGINKIGWGMFFRCESLEEITLPSSVTSIEYNAFGFCNNLETVIFKGKEISLSTQAFQKCAKLKNFNVRINKLGDWAFDGCKSLETVEFTDECTEIPQFAFEYCTSLNNIVLPNTVTNIGEYAFYDCSSLERITVPYQVKIINPSTFYGCSSLKDVILPQGLTKIGSCAFRDCSALENIEFTGNICNVDEWAFDRCSSLKNVKANFGTINEKAFLDCTALESVTDYNFNSEYSNDVFAASNPVIYGFENSSAQSYAEEYGYQFVSLMSGDADGDGEISLNDMAVLKSSLKGYRTLSGAIMQMLDLNHDGSLDAFDMFIIDRMMNGMA